MRSYRAGLEMRSTSWRGLLCRIPGAGLGAPLAAVRVSSLLTATRPRDHEGVQNGHLAGLLSFVNARSSVLYRQALDRRGREVGLDFGEARVLAPEGELAGEPQLALVGVADGQHEIRR